MRRKLLVIALIVALSALGLGSTTAVHAQAPAGPVGLTSDKGTATYPSCVTLTAFAPTAAEITTTALFERERDDIPGVWVAVGTAESSTGRFVLVAAPNTWNCRYRATVEGVQSAPVHVAVTVPLSKPTAAPNPAHYGRVIGMSGTVRPFHPLGTSYMKLQFQYYNAARHRWVRSTEITVSPSQAISNDMSMWRYSMTGSRRQVGTWRVRSFHHCPRHSPSYSAWRTFKITR